MKKITFIRHAQSEANAGGVSRPNAEIGLSETGERQARQLAESWKDKPAMIYVSEFKRTHQTAFHLAEKYGITPIRLSCLNEFNTFGYEVVKGLNGDQRLPLTRQYWEEAEPDARRGETGQTFNEFVKQVASFKAVLTGIPDNSIIVGHGMWFSLFTWRTLGFDMDRVDHDGMKWFFRFHKGLPVGNAAAFDITVQDDMSCSVVFKKGFGLKD